MRKTFLLFFVSAFIFLTEQKLSAQTPGTKKWTFSTNGWVSSSPAIGSDGTIYVGCEDHNLYAINPNGKQKWAFTTGGVVNASPTIGSDGTIYIGSQDNKLYAINPDGKQMWVFTTGSWVRSSPAIGPNGTIYVGSYDNKLYALNLNGTQKWAFTTGDGIATSPVIGSDGTIYIGSADHKFYALNPDGTQKWSISTGGQIFESTPAIGSDGTIFIGSNDNKLYAINPDGTQKWSFSTGTSIYASSPAIGTDGTIYIGSTDSKLYAIYSDCGGLANTAWPKYRGNFKNTGLYEGLSINSQSEFSFIMSGQYFSKAFSITSSDNSSTIITGCTFDNPEFSLGASLPITVIAGSSAQLTAKIQPSSSKLCMSKCTVTYTLNSQTKTISFDISAGLFIEDNSERTQTAHQAYTAYAACIAIDPSSIATRNNLGVLYRLLGETQTAEGIFMGTLSDAINQKYGYAGIAMNYGVTKSDEDTIVKAAAFYTTAWNFISSTESTSTLSPQISYDRAWESYTQDSLSVALININKTLVHSKTNDFLKAKGYVLRGAIYSNQGNMTAAQADFAQAIVLDPNGPIGLLAQQDITIITGVAEKQAEIPSEFTLKANYPNPFNPETRIGYGLEKNRDVAVVIYNVVGQQVRVLTAGHQSAGWHTLNWNGCDDNGKPLSSGVYFLQVRTEIISKVSKMLLLR